MFQEQQACPMPQSDVFALQVSIISVQNFN